MLKSSGVFVCHDHEHYGDEHRAQFTRQLSGEDKKAEAEKAENPVPHLSVTHPAGLLEAGKKYKIEISEIEEEKAKASPASEGI
jgi:hypothetical protein